MATPAPESWETRTSAQRDPTQQEWPPAHPSRLPISPPDGIPLLPASSSKHRGNSHRILSYAARVPARQTLLAPDALPPARESVAIRGVAVPRPDRRKGGTRRRKRRPPAQASFFFLLSRRPNHQAAAGVTVGAI